MKLCDESLCGDLSALTARLERLEKAAAKGAVTRESMREAMAASSFKGITGTVTFDAKGDWVRPYLFVTVKDGKFVVAQ